MPLRDALALIGRNFSDASQLQYKDNPTANFIRREAKDEVRTALGSQAEDLTVKGSAGSGRWAAVPWIAVFDPLVTNSATRGYYVVYLFHSSLPIVHLSLNQGTTEAEKEFGSEGLRVLQERAALMRSRLPDFAGSLAVTEIDLGSTAELPAGYVAGHALGYTYQTDELPSERELRSDLHTIVRAYRALTFRGGREDALEEGAEDEDVIPSASLTERRRYRFHRRIERNPKASKEAKKFHGTRCQACRLDFSERYGPIGKGFIEAHHLRPISSLEEGSVVTYNAASDFAVLCSNCHRMIHRSNDPADVEALRALIAESNSRTQ